MLNVLAGGVSLVRQMQDRLTDWHESTGDFATDAADDRRIGRQVTDVIVADLRDTTDSLLDAQSRWWR